MRFTFSIPNPIRSKVTVNKPYENYTKAGNFSSFGIEIEIKELGLHKTIKSSDPHVLVSKVDSALLGWSAKYEKHLNALNKNARSGDVDSLNQLLLAEQESLNGLLASTLSIDDTIDWNKLKVSSRYSNAT